MRILNKDTDAKAHRIILYLTMTEAEELRNDLNRIIEKPYQNHAHISDEDYQKEITICIYGENLEGFDERSKKIIIEDE